MRVILVPVAGRPESAVALNYAFNLAAELGADVVGCHVRPHRTMPRSLDPVGPRLHADEELDTEVSQAQIQSARDAAHKLFDESAHRHGFPLRKKPTLKTHTVAIWEEFVGSPGRAMAIVGPVSDLLVLTRPRTTRSAKARDFLLAAVLHSSRPVLLLPPRKRGVPGKRVAIAWNQGTEAMLAVVAALPLLQRAETVTIVSRGDEEAAGPKSKHLARYLTHWGIDAQMDHTNEPVSPAVLKTACDNAGADLVVMGAYSKGRLRERLFGGLTEHMLLKSKRAVFLLHTP